jgi:hypothetical protein
VGGDARADVGLPVAEARAAADAAALPVPIGRPAVAAGPRSANGRFAPRPVGGEWPVEVPHREVQLSGVQLSEVQLSEERPREERCLEE